MVGTVAIILIIFGCAFAAIVLLVIIICLCYRRRRRDRKEEKRLLDFPSGGVGIYTPMKTSLPDITTKTETIEHIQPRYSFSIQRRRYSAGALSLTSQSDSSNGSNCDKDSLESQIARRSSLLTVGRTTAALGDRRDSDRIRSISPTQRRLLIEGSVCPSLYQKKGAVYRRESKDKSAKKCGQIHFSLYYDFKTSDLIVHCIQGKDFALPQPTREDQKHLLDPYITLHFIPAVDDRKRQTSLHQQTQNPCFNEYFKFPIAFENLKHHTIKFVVHDFDGSSRENPAFESELDLETVDVSARIEIWSELQPSKIQEQPQEGEMLISLNYLPTAERLTVGTIQAKFDSKTNGKVEMPDIYAKVALHTDGGRQSKRKRTSIKRGTNEPSWNESFVFTNLRQEDLSSSWLQIDLFERHLTASDNHLGHIHIGSNAPGTTGREHWAEMMTSLRKTLPMWHPILNS